MVPKSILPFWQITTVANWSTINHRNISLELAVICLGELRKAILKKKEGSKNQCSSARRQLVIPQVIVTSKTNCGSRRLYGIHQINDGPWRLCRMHHSYALISPTFTATQPPTPPKDTKDKATFPSLSHSKGLSSTELYWDHILKRKPHSHQWFLI